MTGTNINIADDIDVITDAITMAVCTTLLHIITTMITTEPPVTITAEIVYMTITMRDVIVINKNMQLEDQRVLLEKRTTLCITLSEKLTLSLIQ